MISKLLSSAALTGLLVACGGPDGLVDTTAQGLTLPKLSIYSELDFGGAEHTYSTNQPSLPAAVTLWAMSLANESSMPITVYSDANYQGRCQVIPPYFAFDELYTQDIGPGQIRSFRAYGECDRDEGAVVFVNHHVYVTRFRVNVNQVKGAWSRGLAARESKTKSFPANAWSVQVEVQYYGADFKWHHTGQHTVLGDEDRIPSITGVFESEGHLSWYE